MKQKRSNRPINPRIMWPCPACGQPSRTKVGIHGQPGWQCWVCLHERWFADAHRAQR